MPRFDVVVPGKGEQGWQEQGEPQTRLRLQGWLPPEGDACRREVRVTHIKGV